MTGDGRRIPDPRTFGALARAATIATVGVCPVFLMTSSAVYIRGDVPLSESRLGIAVAAFFAAAALGSLPSGRWLEKAPPLLGTTVGIAGSGVALLGLGSSSSWATLLGWIVIAGLFNSMCQLSANKSVAAEVSVASQGLAFGVKQSAIPAATLLGGLAVPLIAASFGWRWVFVVAGGLSTVVLVGQTSGRRAPPARATPAEPFAVDAPLLLLGLGVALGSAAASSMATFLVDHGVASGMEAEAAASMLAIGSLSAIVSRVVIGRRADRRSGGELALVAAMLVVGAVCVGLLGRASGAWALTALTVAAYAIGWGWPGLFNLAVVRRYSYRPAQSTSVTQVGMYAGCVAGPPTFGFLVAARGYSVAWIACSVWLLGSALVVLAVRARFSWR